MIQTRRLDPAVFAAFGHVARSGDGLTRSIRAGKVQLARSPARFHHDAAAAEMSLDFYDVAPDTVPFRAEQAERHPFSAQMFIPMQAVAYLVIVWDGDPRAGAGALAFVGGPQDVVIYNPGVWHHGIVALESRALFASAMWRTDGGQDVEFATLAQPLEVAVDGMP